MRKNTFAFGGFGTRGFALPTVLISSVILLTVLAVTVGAVNAARVALQGQHYSQMASEAAEAGLEMARACIADGYLTWSEPLRAGSDCYGSSSPYCTGADDCFVANNEGVRTTFEVPGPEISGDISTIRSKGITELVRESTGAAWKTYTSSLDMQDTVTEVNQGEEVLWKDFSVGGPHTCAISFNDEVYCWGYNTSGQLGDGTTEHSSVPVKIKQGAIPDGVVPEQISAGRDFTCILGSDGWMYCWGINSSGELGNNSRTDSSVPVALSRGAIPAGVTIAKLGKIAQKTNCAIGSNGRAYCWGLNDYGQIGNGAKSATTSIVPVAVARGAMPADMNVSEITTGAHFGCAIASNSRVYCWGYNSGSEGRLGINSTAVTESLTPIAVVRGALPADMTVSQIGAGLYHTCATASDSKAYCWGRNTQNQMGDNTVTHNLQPAATSAGVMPSDRISTQLGVGLDHACSTASDAWVYCWGMNTNAEGGNGTRTNMAVPVALMQGAIPAGVTLAKVQGGNVHSCGLGTNSKMYCWGNNNQGRLGDGATDLSDTPVEVSAVYRKVDASGFKDIVGTFNHTCGLTLDNKAYCWGWNNAGQLGDGTTTNKSTPTAVSQGDIPANVTIRQLAVNGNYTCALASDNKAYCWGGNASGQLGDGTTTNKSTPTAVSRGAMPAGATVRQITAGDGYACALASDNKAYCWGWNNAGQLGDGTTTNKSTPTAVSQGAIPASVTIRQLVAGGGHTCALLSNSGLYCWGSNASGQLGNGTTGSATNKSTPTAVSQGAIPASVTIRQLTTGGTHTCALASDNKAYCWGNNVYGQLGDNTSGTVNNKSTPTAVSQGAIPSGAAIRQLVAGGGHTCALVSGGGAYCWGWNNAGQLGDGTTGNSATPTAISQGAIPANVTIRQIAAGSNYTCTFASNGRAYCWGGNTYGQLGDSTTANRSIPSVVSQGAAPSGVVIRQLVIGSGHTCALASDINTYCWGYNYSGQLGIGVGGAANNKSSPAVIALGDMPNDAIVRQLAAGVSHTCAVVSDDRVYCWGENANGQLGDGTTGNKPSPVAVSRGAMPTDTKINQITSGNSYNCTLSSDNKAYCWGYNTYGQLGDGTTSNKTAPVAVSQGAMPAGVTIRQLVAGNNHICSVASDNKAYCWGQGSYGQLGDGTTVSKSTPVAVSQGAIPAGLTIRQLTAGSLHTCALASDNKAYCWGYNTYGQLGDGTTSNKTAPVAVSQGAMPAGVTIRQLVAGGNHTCALASDNKSYCWGYNTYGQLGNDATVNESRPVATSRESTPANLTIRQLTAGGDHTCATGSDSKVYCWGYNIRGQLGEGSTVSRPTLTAADYIPGSPYTPEYLLIGPRHYF